MQIIYRSTGWTTNKAFPQESITPFGMGIGTSKGKGKTQLAYDGLSVFPDNIRNLPVQELIM